MPVPVLVCQMTSTLKHLTYQFKVGCEEFPAPRESLGEVLELQAQEVHASLLP